MATTIPKTLPTNLNRKFGSDAFVHIDRVPQAPLTDKKAERITVELSAADGSHPPVLVRLEDVARVPLDKIPSIITWCSHGMDRFHLVKHMLETYPELRFDSEVAIYFYRKVPLS